jgi:hypothetical protein
MKKYATIFRTTRYNPSIFCVVLKKTTETFKINGLRLTFERRIPIATRLKTRTFKITGLRANI